MQPWLSWNSLCRPGCPGTQKSACLCLPSAGIKGVRHHARLSFSFFYLFSIVCTPQHACVHRAQLVGVSPLLPPCEPQISRMEPSQPMLLAQQQGFKKQTLTKEFPLCFSLLFCFFLNYLESFSLQLLDQS